MPKKYESPEFGGRGLSTPQTGPGSHVVAGQRTVRGLITVEGVAGGGASVAG